jgi:type I restriction-modification system DNA methylase subunit
MDAKNIEALKLLVESFQRDEVDYTKSSSSYQETEVRVEFIDPLFELLGWEMGKSTQRFSLRDVLREESQKTETTTKKPDYTFRISAARKFFVEAKKPSVDVEVHQASALQVRRYGYTAGLPISILTNFKTLRVYDTSFEPKPTDGADVGLLLNYHYTEFVDKFDEIYGIFGRENVALGAIESKFGSQTTGSIPANSTFLERINRWRLDISKDLVTNYPTISHEDISDIAQKVINRIIFIRMCEDRGIEGEDVLRKAVNKKNFLAIRSLFQQMDERYNTGLFDVLSDCLQTNYEISSDIFLKIVDEIYTPNSPYSFSVLDADFLGQVYELFLGERVEIGSGGVVLKKKPDYEHREIVTTPQPIVDEVVKRSLSAKFPNGFKSKDVKSLRIFDVATGSGRFILRAFEELSNYLVSAYEEEQAFGNLYRLSDGVYKLTFDEKKKLLQTCFYGVDIDFNAVEVARFSLLVKLLEDEVKESLPTSKKILPNLDSNIVYGNSIVESDFKGKTTNSDIETVPFTPVDEGFPENFDVLIGNPPYMKTSDIKKFNKEEFDYLKAKYSSCTKQFDKYFAFIEMAINRTSVNGVIGLVIPNKWINIESARKLREMLSKNVFVCEIVDFGNEKLFEGKSAYTCILVLTKTKQSFFYYRYISKTPEFLIHSNAKGYKSSIKRIMRWQSEPWILTQNFSEKTLVRKLHKSRLKLSDICDIANGIQTSANDVFLITDFEDLGATIQFKKKDNATKQVKTWEIEKAITRPYVDDSGALSSYSEVKSDALVIFPYKRSIQNKPIPLTTNDLQTQYPRAWDYLNSHKDRLENRDVQPEPKVGEFYVFGRHQALDVVFETPKIIFSVNQRGDKYAFDKTGSAYASGGTAGELAILRPKHGFSLEFILALLHQKPIEFFARKRGSPFGGGWFARGSAVVSDIPIPAMDLSGNTDHQQIHNTIKENVEKIVEITAQFSNASPKQKIILTRQKQKLLEDNKDYFYQLWGLDKASTESIDLPGE